MTSPLLIVNPSSGRERGVEYADEIAEGLRRKFGVVEVARTAGDGDAERVARAYAASGGRLLFVGGGDGTVNEALNGVVSSGRLADVTFGIVPLGTGNDFAKALGIPLEIPECLETLFAGRVLQVDVGVVNGRHFLNTSGGGFIAEVSVAVTPQLKTVAGRLAYLIGGAQALMEYEPVRATVMAEPGRFRMGLGLHTFAVCNSRLIGGGRLIAPDAIIDDGLLDLCLIEAMGSVEFLTLARKVADGEHVEDPRVRYVQASSIVIDLDRETKINTDGEVLTAMRCEYSILPRAATFLSGEPLFALSGRPSSAPGEGVAAGRDEEAPVPRKEQI